MSSAYIEIVAASLASPTAFRVAFEQARERNGACMVDRLPQFMAAVLDSCRPTATQLRQLGEGAARLQSTIENQARAWFLQNATPF